MNTRKSFAMSIRFLALFCAVLVSGFTHAATYQVYCDNGFEKASQGCTIKLTGKIETGDSDRLRTVIRQRLKPSWRYQHLFLDSPGGDVYEAFRLAEVVREALLDTTTFRPMGAQHEHASCVSACFLVWVAGANRISQNWPEYGRYGLGLHRPYFDPATYKNSATEVSELQQKAMLLIQEYLRKELVPETLIEKMFRRSSKEVYWIDDIEDSAIDVRAPWFEEMMIAQCGFEPKYERDANVRHVQQILKGKVGSTKDAAYVAYLNWRQKYNVCEYEIRRAAQERMKK